MSESERYTVEVTYALPDKQSLIALEVTSGTTAIEAVNSSGILLEYPELDSEKLALGIFSKSCKHDTLLKPFDRVEIYRPLAADPKEIRKRRALEMAEKKKQSKQP
jgi:uncharacterized protein